LLALPLRTVAASVAHTTRVHGVFKAGIVVEDYERTWTSPETQVPAMGREAVVNARDLPS
jgi:hypothetical protein